MKNFLFKEFEINFIGSFEIEVVFGSWWLVGLGFIGMFCYEFGIWELFKKMVVCVFCV